MTNKSEYHWVNWLLAIGFMTATSIVILMIASQSAWTILETNEFTFWLNILTPTLAVSASGVAIYSFVSYLQNREIRNLMLIMIAINIILWVFLYLLTHPASVDWSPYLVDQSRDRNRTIVILLGVTFPPSIILGLLSKKTKTTKISSILLVLWGIVLMPLIYLWALLSADVTFIVTLPEGGISGITPLGWLAVIFIAFSTIIATIGYVEQWLSTRDPIDLSIMLALFLWLLAVILVIVLWDPFQVAELVWYACLICGFALISTAQIISSVIQPYRDLETIVEKRTNELEQSQLESDFYLNMWTHKMGNLLQGMVTYLEILEYAKQNSVEDQETRHVASKLSAEARLVNHQVLQLMRVKESYHQELDQVELTNSISRSISTALSFFDDGVTFDFTSDQIYFMKADDLIELLFLSIIIFLAKSRMNDDLCISISIIPKADVLEVSIGSEGRTHSQNVQEFLDHSDVPNDITIDLELYTIRLMMKRYGGTITHHYDSSNETNNYVLEFKT